MVIINSKVFMYLPAGTGPGSESKKAKKKDTVSAWIGLQYTCGAPSFLYMNCLSWVHLLDRSKGKCALYAEHCFAVFPDGVSPKKAHFSDNGSKRRNRPSQQTHASLIPHPLSVRPCSRCHLASVSQQACLTLP